MKCWVGSRKGEGEVVDVGRLKGMGKEDYGSRALGQIKIKLVGTVFLMTQYKI